MISFKARTATGQIIKSALSAFTFPAGEKHIKQEEHRELEPTEIAIFRPEAATMHDDLFQLQMWAEYAQLKNSKTVIIAPYVPGARADRGTPFGARVYAKFLAEMWVNEIIIYDPHSPVIVDELKLWAYQADATSPAAAITVIYPKDILNTRNSKVVMPNIYDGIIAPDKGAVERAGDVAEALGLPLFTAEKTRDFNTGKLTGFSIDMPATGHYLIVDDICDGGGTFLGLAGAAPDTVKLDLYVSHGVFSKDAINALPLKFNRIFTTNSYAPLRDLNNGAENAFGNLSEDDPFRRIEIIRPLLERITV